MQKNIWKPSKYTRNKKKIPSDLAFPLLFGKVTLIEIINEIKNLGKSKATQSNDIPTKVIKENYDISATFITENFKYHDRNLFS